jgi:hypothetical protein
MRITAQTTNGDLISSTLTDKKVLGEKLIEFASLMSLITERAI